MGASLQQVDHETSRAPRVFADALAGRFDVSEARVFGSCARGTHTLESDVDVAVLLRGLSGDFLATKLAMADIAFDAK